MAQQTPLLPFREPRTTPRGRDDGGAGRIPPKHRALKLRNGRAWINGREVGGTDPRFAHLNDSYD
jgi:hypothetical protein